MPAGDNGAVSTHDFDLQGLGTGLTFAASVPSLLAELASGARAVVVQAPPGTGKTTLVPPAVANAVEAGPGRRVIVTQPRRVAARAAARRISVLDGAQLGGRVGFSVRGESKVSADTLIEFVTPGLLLRRLLADPGLEGVAAVILDEVHERQLDTDVLLGLLGEVRELRDDLTLVAMSATLDAPRFAGLLGSESGPAPLVDSASALFPLEVRWAPAPGTRQDTRGVTPAFLEHVASTAASSHARALAADPACDALVFLPGVREVNRVVERLMSLAPGTEVLALHGQVPAAQQDRAVSGREPGGKPRIIVSTALAESSLTVPGVRLVVDAGLSREPRRDAARGMSGLVTVAASRASATQRAGRAARLGHGVVVRCYDERSYAAAPEHVTPEILTADLTQAALTFAVWGTPRGEGLRLPDAPPAAAMDEAEATLRALAAVDAVGRATGEGEALASLPLEPRWGRALLDGARVVGARQAADIVALATGEIRADGADLPGALRAAKGGHARGAEGFKREAQRLERMLSGRAGVATSSKVAGGSGRPGSSAGAAHGSKHGSVRGGANAGAGAAPGNGEAQGTGAAAVVRGDELGFVVALAWPERIARRVSTEVYLLASGTRAGLPQGSALAGQEWLAIADVSRAEGRAAAGTGAVIRAAAPLDEEAASLAGAALLRDEVVARFDGAKVTARRVRALGAIEFSSTPVKPDVAAGRLAVAQAMREQGLGALRWGENAQELRNRLGFLRRELGEPWPDVSDAGLLAGLDSWLGPELERLAKGVPAEKIDLLDPLRRLLPWPAASRLDELAPTRMGVPSGNTAAVKYPEVGSDGPPVVAVKLQECFGWAQTPRLADGRAPVLFHLLSPGRFPLAVTDDLASFWSGPYAQVRSEMRGRYPRHPWPEDPWSAQATHLTKRRLEGR